MCFVVVGWCRFVVCAGGWWVLAGVRCWWMVGVRGCLLGHPFQGGDKATRLSGSLLGPVFKIVCLCFLPVVFHYFFFFRFGLLLFFVFF